jgi:nitrogen fixation NifU-like protein
MSDSLYPDAIKELARAAHGHGHLDDADYSARLDNPLCGDRIDIGVRIAGDRIVALGQVTKGCLLCRAAASLLGLRAPGERLADIAAVGAALRHMLQADGAMPAAWPELAAFLPVRDHRSRHGCVLLPFDAVQNISSQWVDSQGRFPPAS